MDREKAAEEADEVEVVLVSCGDNKVNVIREICAITGWDLMKVKNAVKKGLPVSLLKGPRKIAEEARKRLFECGASVEFKYSGTASSKKNYKDILAGLHNGSSIYVVSFNEKKLDAAMASYGKSFIKSKNDIILHHDSTVFGGGKNGFLLTEYGITCKNWGLEAKEIRFTSRTTVDFETAAAGKNNFDLIFDEGDVSVLCTSVEEDHMELLVDTIREIIRDLPVNEKKIRQ